MPWDKDTAVVGVAPVSIKAGANPNARRILAGVTTTTAAPASDTDGYYAGSFKYLHIDIKLVGGTNASFKLWRWSAVSGLWKLDTRLGVNGTLTISTSDTANNPFGGIVESAFTDRVYLQVTAVSGPPTISAWIGGA